MDNSPPNAARDLLRVEAKPKASDRPRAFALPYLTAYTIHWLNDWEIPTTYENISVLNARLFPEEFALVGFPELPDAMRTNRTLLQMRPKYRGFATSDPRRGVYLTNKGRDAAMLVYNALGGPVIGGAELELSPQSLDHADRSQGQRTRDPRAIVNDAKQKLLYRRYQAGGLAEVDVVHLLGLLSLYDHTPPAEVKKAFRQLRNDAVSANDVAFAEFLNAVEERFHSYINRTP